jgi:hypothetical protein
MIRRLARTWIDLNRSIVTCHLSDALVPIRRDAVHFSGQLVDVRIQPALADTGANQTAFLDFAEQALSLELGCAKFCNSLLFANVYWKGGV